MSNAATVYRKTDAGIEAIASRDAALAPKLRRLLILINGADSAGDLCRKLALPDSDLSVFEQLVALGFAEVSHDAALVSRTRGMHGAQEAPRFLKAKAYMLEVATSLLSDHSHAIVKSVHQADDEAALLACAEACRKLIAALSDRATADNFLAKVRSMLG